MKNRQLDILIYLLKYKKTTYTILSKHFEVSTKTIERDINRLAASGIPIYCQQGTGGGVFLDENYKFTTSFFTPEEIYHIVTALHIARTFTTNPLNQEITNKLCLVAPNITTMFEQNVQDYFSLDLYDHPVDFNQGFYPLINQCLDFRYYATINNKEFIVCLGYVYKPDGIYLFAYDQDYILLKMSTITSFECSNESYTKQYLTYYQYKNQ